MRTRRFRTIVTTVVSVGLLGACAEMNQPAPARVSPGVLQLRGHPAPSGAESGSNDNVQWTVPPGDGTILPRRVLTAPDTVNAGEPFEVTVETIGEGGCWRSDRQEVVVSGRTVELRPYDAHSGAEVCTMILLYLQHRSTLTLNEPGEWTLRVSGRRVTAGEGEQEVGVSAEQTIVVR